MDQKNALTFKEYEAKYCLHKNSEKITIREFELLDLNGIEEYTNLKLLDCSYNDIENVDNLPDSLEVLNCKHNKINYMDNLPSNLKVLNCNSNPIIKLLNLPEGLQSLNCNNTYIQPQNINFPDNLKYFYCNSVYLKSVNCLKDEDIDKITKLRNFGVLNYTNYNKLLLDHKKRFLKTKSANY